MYMQELSNLYDLKVLGKLLMIGNMTSFHTNNKKMIFAIILTQWNENKSMVLYLLCGWRQMHPTLEVMNNIVIMGETKVWVYGILII